jgi:hypothetical protein
MTQILGVKKDAQTSCTYLYYVNLKYVYLHKQVGFCARTNRKKGRRTQTNRTHI